MLLLFIAPPASHVGAQVFPCPDGESLIGDIRVYKVKDGESLIELARDMDLGYNEIMDANPGLDPFVPGKDSIVLIPTSWVLPDMPVSYEGIVINLPEMRLYYFFKKNGKRMVDTFPVGIGSESTPTPEGNLRVIEKIVHPVWQVPESIKREKPYLPDIVPPGPDNPLGTHAMRLSKSSYLIHGTNKPWGIGRRFSHGCIRLYPEDIQDLFKLVPEGTRVAVVSQSIKIGKSGKNIYIEVHSGEDNGHYDYLYEAMRLLGKKRLLNMISFKKLNKAILEKSGMPADISLQ